VSWRISDRTAEEEGDELSILQKEMKTHRTGCSFSCMEVPQHCVVEFMSTDLEVPFGAVKGI